MDILEWVKHASVLDLRIMREQCELALRARSYVCGPCGATIPTALPLMHPAHVKGCTRYASMVSY